MTPFKRFSASVMLLALGATLSAGENWPQWRGPGSQGISSEAALPTEWSSVKNIVWKTALPAGHSSPIVWENRIFLTAAIEGEVVPGAKAVNHTVDGQVWLHPDSVAADKKHTLKLLSLEAGTGKVLWERTAYEGTVYDARHRRSSFAGPTAATDGTMVFAYFGPEGLYAYDFSGRLAWKAVERFKTLGLGTGTSPVLYRNLVIIQRDEDEGKESVIAAYDKATGKEAWKTRRPVQISWSTPALVTVPNGTELVTNGSEFAIGYDPATGRELWRTTGVESNAIHTPLVGKGLVIMTAGYPAKKVIAIRPGTVSSDRRVAWQYAKGTGYVISNLFYGDYVYLLTDNGVVTCLDAETGAVKYEGGRPATPSRFTASPVAYNGIIAMTSEDGETFMLKAGPVHTILGSNTLDEPVYSSPAIAGGRIYIRGDKHLFAIGSVAQ
jgi:outer membrane protein assembly factor BamB